MAWFIRRPRILRRPRIIPRSVRVGPVWVSKTRRGVTLGPVGYTERKKNR
jgi:hypothetical protein